MGCWGWCCGRVESVKGKRGTGVSCNISHDMTNDMKSVQTEPQKPRGLASGPTPSAREVRGTSAVDKHSADIHSCHTDVTHSTRGLKILRRMGLSDTFLLAPTSLSVSCWISCLRVAFSYTHAWSDATTGYVCTRVMHPDCRNRAHLYTRMAKRHAATKR